MSRLDPTGTLLSPAALLQAHEALVAELLRPGACGGHAGVAQRLDTHLSTLLLAGELVFKLKKPVAFGFVDFSTLALRQDACEQELRLNRRTAPRWYLAVLPVRQGVHGAFISAPAASMAMPALASGPVLDWAVVMRRFDASQGFDHLADAGALSELQIDALAAAVAQFHSRLPPAPPGHGRPEAVLHWARENLVELAALLQTLAVTSQTAAALLAPLADLQQWSEQRGLALAPLMALRARTGHVREVHGDLHLGNIVWADDAPLLFDALEFNDTLRHTDTVGDLAFTFMDLLARGLPQLAWRYISQVLEASGDHAGLPLLGWWAAYRAAVRAKVALLSVGTDPAVALAAAGRYLALAQRLASPAPAAWLLLCAGLSGSGKSTVALLLAQQLGAVRLRSDVERKRLHGLAANARPLPSNGLYSADSTARTYARLADLAQLALQAGITVVVDAAALQREQRDGLRALASREDIAFGLVWCQADVATLQQRLARRLAAGGDASDATPQLLDQQLRSVQPPAADEATHTWWLDTEVPLAALPLRCAALASAWAARAAGHGPAAAPQPSAPAAGAV